MHVRGEDQPASVSDLALCLQSIANEGRAVIVAESSTADDTDALPLLQQLDALARDELALPLPDFSPGAALWGARLFHQLCRFMGENQIAAVCAVPCPEPRSPATDWSVDLTLHHLPKLFQLARHFSSGDPLIEQIQRIAAAWPLSSVGIPGLQNLSLESFVGDASLRRIYADRVASANDTSRLGHPQLDDLLRADLGLHRDLAPAIAAKLFESNHESN
jgi:hypothetical protein